MPHIEVFSDPQDKEKVVYRVNYGSKDKSLLQFINSMNSNISTINNSSNQSQNTSKSAGNTLSNRLLESQSELTLKKKEVKILDIMGKEMPWGNYEFEVIDTIDLTDMGFQTSLQSISWVSLWDSEIDITGQKHDVTQVASDIQMLLGNMPDIENCAEPEILSNEDGQVTFRAILSTNHS